MSGLGNKEIMAKNIVYYMKEKGKDRNDVCNDLGFSYGAMSDWIKGRTYPRIDKIEMMADYFGINKSDLIEERRKGGTYEKLHYVKRVPLLGIIPGGAPMLALESYDEYIPVTDSTLDYALKVVGNSMINARIQDGDTVFVDKNASINNGDIVVALVNGNEATLKRYYLYGDMVVLRPDNPEMDEQHYPADEVRILGKVKKVVYDLK